MMIQLSVEEKLFLDALFSLKLYPETDESNKEMPSTLDSIQKRGLELHNWKINGKSDELNLKDISNLLIKKELLHRTENVYSLTGIGKNNAIAIRGRRIGDRFSSEFVRIATSAAYSKFCERVFGKDLSQANMMDMVQLDKLLEVLNLSSKNKVLDLGCGLGKISEYISDVTSAFVLGIDLANEAINLANKRTQEKQQRLDYQIGDINNLTLSSNSFDTIIAIATLHYTIDINKTINQLKEILTPQGQIGIFTFQYAFENDNPDILHPDNTNLAQVLKKNNLEFRTWDFTDNEIKIRQKQLLIANELKEQFEEEGNIDLYNDRIEECEIDLKRLLSGQKRRFLYHIQLS
ncbi:MAG: methyltransferase domain-containing protein [Asgard group archaeon]|nr:methyltransferase domain-containing protein [Asgard group archaeon]